MATNRNDVDKAGYSAVISWNELRDPRKPNERILCCQPEKPRRKITERAAVAPYSFINRLYFREDTSFYNLTLMIDQQIPRGSPFRAKHAIYYENYIYY